MKTIIYKCLSLALIVLCLICSILLREVKRIRYDRDRYKENSTALLSDMKRMQLDSITSAVDVKSLRLSLNEYKRYRSEDAELIKKLNIRIKSLQATVNSRLEIVAPIDVPLTDTIVKRDTILLPVQKIEMNSPHLMINGMIENNRLTGQINLPVNIHQFVWIEHKYRFLWWRWGIKALHQTISTDNPHVHIKYTEMIRIEK